MKVRYWEVVMDPPFKASWLLDRIMTRSEKTWVWNDTVMGRHGGRDSQNPG